MNLLQFKQSTPRLLLAFLLCWITASNTIGKGLEGRMGFGVSARDSLTTPAVSARYHFSKYISGTFLVGFDTRSDIDAFTVGGKIYRNLHLEDNLNFYIGTGLFLLSEKQGTVSQSGFQFDGVVGAEFFLPGLPNLGFQFETGVGVRSLDTISFKTIGSPFLGAGIHYYF